MDARAWRLAAGAGTALLVLVALVAWRADSLTGGWLLALRVTGLLAVVGLLSAVVLGCLAALRPPSAAEVVVRVSASGAPQTTSRSARRALVPLTAVLLLAVLSAAPVLVVLVLATGPRSAAAPSEREQAGGGAPGEPQQPSLPQPPPSPATSSPSPTTPSGGAPSGGAPSGGAEPSSVPAPSPVPSPASPPPPSPSQLPSEAAAAAVCEQVVVDGDSLWSVAQSQLGPGAPAADVDARWRALYARNAAAVGPDPDLIHPGLALRTCA